MDVIVLGLMMQLDMDYAAEQLLIREGAVACLAPRAQWCKEVDAEMARQGLIDPAAREFLCGSYYDDWVALPLRNVLAYVTPDGRLWLASSGRCGTRPLRRELDELAWIVRAPVGRLPDVVRVQKNGQ
jgi:hypothetical protein